jgi:hypothetical protein
MLILLHNTLDERWGYMASLINLKETYDDFEVEFDVIPAVDIPNTLDDRQKKIILDLSSVEKQINENKLKINDINANIDKLTNHADGIDYTIAVASGVITGLIDSFFVGEFNFKSAKAKSNKQINNFVTNYAKMKGYKGERLSGSIEFLEKKYPVAQDNLWGGKQMGVGSKNHHLDDLAHHPTMLGLAAAVAVQFFRLGIFVNRDGEWHFEFTDTEPCLKTSII